MDLVVAVEPESSTSLRDVALQHLQAGQWSNAIQVCQQALQAKPDDTSVLFVLGAAHASGRQWEASSSAFQQLLDQDASSAPAHLHKANADFELGKFAEALAGYRKALELSPTADGWNNLGTALAQLGSLEEAIAAFREAVQLDAQLESAHVNLIRALRLAGDSGAAVSAAHEALEGEVRSPRILAMLGKIWLDDKVIDNAIACLEAAAERDPDSPEIRLHLGLAYCSNGQLQQAETQFVKAGERGASMAVVHANLGEISRKRRDLRGAMRHQQKSLAADPMAPEVHSNLLLTMLYDEDVTGADLHAEAGRWYERHGQNIESLPPVSRPSSDVIRVGYLSGSLHQHPVGLFLEPVLANHDPDRFQIHCYAHQESKDEVTDQLRLSCNHWLDITSMSDSEVAQQIRRDEVDILVDLCGHSAPNRLRVFSYRPAPIQLTWMGYSSTTGSRDIDGVIGDRWVTPEEDAANFTERIVRMPEHYLCFAPPEEDVPVTRAGREGVFTYGCLNNLSKMGPTVVAAWSRILSQAPDAALFLKSPSLTDERVREEVRQTFAERGIDPQRIQLEGQGTRDDFFEAYRHIDLALDPFPFHGGMTTMETFWMGIPMVTLVGQRFVARVGESFLRAMGDEARITHSLDDYVRVAVECSQSIWTTDEREAFRNRFLESPLCDAQTFTQQLEDLYRNLLTDSR